MEAVSDQRFVILPFKTQSHSPLTRNGAFRSDFAATSFLAYIPPLRATTEERLIKRSCGIDRIAEYSFALVYLARCEDLETGVASVDRKISHWARESFEVRAMACKPKRTRTIHKSKSSIQEDIKLTNSSTGTRAR